MISPARAIQSKTLFFSELYRIGSHRLLADKLTCSHGPSASHAVIVSIFNELCYSIKCKIKIPYNCNITLLIEAYT